MKNIRKFKSFGSALRESKKEDEFKKEIKEKLMKKFEEEKPGVTKEERETWAEYAMGVITEFMSNLPFHL
jgi:hypothetical protein